MNQTTIPTLSLKSCYTSFSFISIKLPFMNASCTMFLSLKTKLLGQISWSWTITMLVAYLSHVADYNGHNDPIDRDSFTEDDASARHKNQISGWVLSRQLVLTSHYWMATTCLHEEGNYKLFSCPVFQRRGGSTWTQKYCSTTCFVVQQLFTSITRNKWLNKIK